MKYLFLILLSFNAFADSYMEAADLINKIRPNLQTKNMSVEITQLDGLITQENLNVARFGFGRGVIPFWKKTNGEFVESHLQEQCEINKDIYIKSLLELSNYKHPSENVSFKFHGQLEGSILTENKAQEAFFAMHAYQDKLVPEEYGTRCESRAHAISMLLDSMCIQSAKVFIESEKRIFFKDHAWSWTYHVAPVVMVMTEEGITPFVFDHSIFNKAVPLKTWIDTLMKNNPENNYDVFFTSRYVLLPSARDSTHQEYRELDIKESDRRLMLGRLLRLIRPFKGPL